MGTKASSRSGSRPGLKVNRDENSTADKACASPAAADALENTQIHKFRTKGGAGFAAEEANAQSDRLHFKKVEMTGTDNRKNGADRIVDGQAIQCKYYPTGAKSVAAAFDEQTGHYRYPGQALEIPKGQYREGLEAMRAKIREGKVPGVSDPAEAEKMVKEGSVTYHQAVNIKRAGTLDSLVYDAKTQAVTAAGVFGISFAVQFCRMKWEGADTRMALRESLGEALVAGGLTLAAGIAAAQLLRTKIALLGSVAVKNGIEALARTSFGQAAVEKLAQASLKRAVHGAAAVNHVSKLCRSNAVTAAVTLAVTSGPDLYRAIIADSTSWRQFSKNLAGRAAGLAGGTCGWMVGAAAGAAVGSAVPVIGTAVGAVVGGILFGIGGALLAEKATNKVLDCFVEDDAVEMTALVEAAMVELAEDFMLSAAELHELMDNLGPKLTPAWLRDMYAAGAGGGDSARKDFAREAIDAECLKIARKRPPVCLPTDAEVLAEVERIVAEALGDLDRETRLGAEPEVDLALDAWIPAPLFSRAICPPPFCFGRGPPSRWAARQYALAF